MSTIKQVRAFIAVAQTRSFAEASSQIHLSQPALSIAIKNLETSLGGPLLSRSTRTLALTPEGAEFLPTAKRLIREWDDALEDIHNVFSLRRGRISIAAMPSFACNLLPKVLVEFRQKNPKINISVHDVVAEQVVAMVRAGRVEIGFAFEPPASDDLIFTPLYEDEFVAVISPDKPIAKNKKITWKKLLEHDFITLQRPSSIRALLEDSLSRHNLNFSLAFETHQLATIGRMVANGLGVSAVPNLCKTQMEEMGAVCLALEKPAVVKKVGIITRRRYPLSVAAQAIHQSFTASWLSAGSGETPAKSSKTTAGDPSNKA